MRTGRQRQSSFTRAAKDYTVSPSISWNFRETPVVPFILKLSFHLSDQHRKAGVCWLQVEIEKPLGLKLGESKSPGGGLKVTGVSGNAAKSGIKVGDTVIYTSSFFGDELWPADKLGFSRSAIGACPSPVCFVYVRTLFYHCLQNFKEESCCERN